MLYYHLRYKTQKSILTEAESSKIYLYAKKAASQVGRTNLCEKENVCFIHQLDYCGIIPSSPSKKHVECILILTKVSF